MRTPNVIKLLRNPNKSRSLRQLLNRPRAHISAAAPDPSQDVHDGVGDRALVGDGHRLTFGRPVVRYAAGVLLHGGGTAHPIKELHLAPVLPDDELPSALVVPREHPPSHDEVPPRAQRLGEVARAGAAAVGDDVASKAVRGVGALDDGGELRVANARLLAGGADASGALGGRTKGRELDPNGTTTLFDVYKGVEFRVGGSNSPIPTLMTSAPLRMSSSVISHVTTFPAMMTWSGKRERALRTAAMKNSE